MGIFDNAINTVKDVAASAGKKTDEAIKFSKLKIQESQINGEIENNFRELGEVVYSMYKDNEKPNPEFDALIKELDEHYQSLENIGVEIDELRNEVACPECGAKTDNSNSYCPKCGAKLPIKLEPQKPEEDTVNSDEEDTAEMELTEDTETDAAEENVETEKED